MVKSLRLAQVMSSLCEALGLKRVRRLTLTYDYESRGLLHVVAECTAVSEDGAVEVIDGQLVPLIKELTVIDSHLFGAH